MGRSQESWNKKEKEKKKKKKREEKAKRKEERKAASESGEGISEFMYVDKFGNLTPEPPVYDEEDEIEAEDIVVGIPKKEKDPDEDKFRKKGTVTFFNDSKGFGFIKEERTGDSIFVHINDVIDKISEHDKVTFEVVPGQKGPMAVNVETAG